VGGFEKIRVWNLSGVSPMAAQLIPVPFSTSPRNVAKKSQKKAAQFRWKKPGS
jgi:hypothetical protein